MNPYADTLLEAAHAVSAALDAIETTTNVADLAEAMHEASKKLNELTAAAGGVNDYLEQLIRAAQKELGMGGGA
jgi:hypothetical protein